MRSESHRYEFVDMFTGELVPMQKTPEEQGPNRRSANMSTSVRSNSLPLSIPSREVAQEL